MAGMRAPAVVMVHGVSIIPRIAQCQSEPTGHLFDGFAHEKPLLAD